tara:strand:+ start:7005 stop:8711 length:1707 start_codon:yes stop_codon:yes gene_type:complete
VQLILREYLASLNERNELDALLPDLLSQMGLEVFSKPGIGSRQYGVDIAAYGSIDGEVSKVYLFSVKGGDLGRKDWNSGSVQDLQPSLDEIITVYIPTHLPSEYKNFPIEICICFGGDLNENVRLNVTQYEERNSTDLISFSEWGGEKVALYIEKYLLKEELVPKKFRRLLGKSLALLDEPDVSHKNFLKLIQMLIDVDIQKGSEVVKAIRQLNIVLWILFSWCRESGNLESAYLASELTLLYAWDLSKPYLEKKSKAANAIRKTLNAIQCLNYQISMSYVDTKIVPHTNKLYALSNAVAPSCNVDVNLKMFDILGRLSLTGLWASWFIQHLPQEDVELCQKARHELRQYQDAVKQLINNNPILLTPYKDDQAIDITIAFCFLALSQENDKYIHDWLLTLVERIGFNFRTHSHYPCNLNSYHELIEYPIEKTAQYREEITAGSILYPYLAMFSALLGFDDVYGKVQELKTELLSHCNFQIWYPDEMTESDLYLNKSNHGATLSDVCIDKGKEEFLEQLFTECDESNSFDELTANKFGRWPLVFVACRHYRVPVPIHFLKDAGVASGEL